MGNVEVAYSLTDDFHNKHLQCSDIRGYSIENGSVRRFVAQNVNVEMLFLKWECSLCLLLVLSNCSEPVGYLQAWPRKCTPCKPPAQMFFWLVTQSSPTWGRNAWRIPKNVNGKRAELEPRASGLRVPRSEHSVTSAEPSPALKRFEEQLPYYRKHILQVLFYLFHERRSSPIKW